MINWVSSFEVALNLSKLVISVVMLAILGVQDLKSRELNARFVHIYLFSSATAFIVSTFFVEDIPPIGRLIYSAFSLVTCGGLLALLYKIGLVGNGDVYVSTALGLMFPYPSAYKLTLASAGILPPSLVIMLYASLLGALFAAINAVIVTSRYRAVLSKVPGKIKLVLPFIARPIKLIEYVEGRARHYIPVQAFRVINGRVVSEYSLITNLSRGPDELKALVSRGVLSPDTYVWLSPGLPFVFYLFIGLVAMAILGDKPVILLLLMLVT